MGRYSQKVSYWNANSESRQVLVLYNYFISNRQIRRELAVSESDFVGYDQMASFLDNVVAHVSQNKRSEASYLIDREMSDLNREFDCDLLDDPIEVKKCMLKIFTAKSIPEQSFDWLDVKNSELCSFAWSYLISSDIQNGQLKCTQKILFDGDSPVGTMDSQSRSIRKHIGNVCDLVTNTSNNQGKRDFVVCYFDLLRNYDSPVAEQTTSISYVDALLEGLENSDGYDVCSNVLKWKSAILAQLHDEWNSTKNDTKMNDWLAKNEDMASWAYGYIEKSLFKGRKPVWLDLSSSSEKEKNEKCRMALATIYNLFDNNGKYVMRTSLTKSGAQQKYRLKTEKRKPSSIPLSERHKDMLKELASRENKKIYQIVEALIEEAYGVR